MCSSSALLYRGHHTGLIDSLDTQPIALVFDTRVNKGRRVARESDAEMSGGIRAFYMEGTCTWSGPRNVRNAAESRREPCPLSVWVSRV